MLQTISLMAIPSLAPDIAKTVIEVLLDRRRKDELKQLVKQLKPDFPKARKLLMQPEALKEIRFYAESGDFDEAKMITAVRPVTESDDEAKRLANAIRERMSAALPDPKRANFHMLRTIAEIKRDGKARDAELIAEMEARQPRIAAKLPAARALPAKTKQFADRREALKQAQKHLRQKGNDGSARIVNCVGMIGAGTSAFALELAYGPPGKLSGGALYVDFAAPVARNSDAGEIAAGLLVDLGVDRNSIPPDPEERLRQLRSLYALAPVLIVFDNASPASDIEPLIPPQPESIVIVSSQTALANLQLAELIELAPMAEDDALMVLAAIIGQRVRDEPQAAAEIARCCGGLPLALSVIASRIRGQPKRPLGTYAKQLANTGDLLQALDDRQKTLRRALRNAIDMAEPDARELLLLLGALDVHAIEASIVAAILEIDEIEAEDRIAGLVDLGLLSEIEGGGWQIHDLLRQLAAQLAPVELDAKRIKAAAARRADTRATEAVAHSHAIKRRS
jgi:hypothetical protein